MDPSRHSRGALAGSRLLAASVGLTLALSASALHADELSDLRQRLDGQEQQIKMLERKLGLREEAERAALPATAIVRATPTEGFRIQSADNANVVRLRGVFHFDGRYFLDDVASPASDTWLLRRVRPTLEGTLNGIWDFRFTPDFAGGRSIILDAFGAVRLKPWAVITAGKFKVPVGLERLVSAADLKFIERGFPTILVPNRDLGVQIGGDIAGGVAQYSVGLFNGVIDGGSSDAQADAELDDDRDVAARLFFQPFLNSDNLALRGLGFGIAGTYVNALGNVQNPLLPAYRTPDQQPFFRFRADDAGTPTLNEGVYLDGERLRVTPQAYYYVGSFGALAEYVKVSQEVSRDTLDGLRSEDLDTTAWQLQLSYFLTGEKASYKGFTPISTFNVGAPGWGAFEIVARHQQLEIDDLAFEGGAASFADPATQPRKASAYTLGLNWYFNQNFKWQVNYEHVEFDGGAANGADRDDGKAILTRFAVGF